MSLLIIIKRNYKIERHIQRKHTGKCKDITASCHLDSVCIDLLNEVYVVIKCFHGSYTPLHVKNKVLGGRSTCVLWVGKWVPGEQGFGMEECLESLSVHTHLINYILYVLCLHSLKCLKKRALMRWWEASGLVKKITIDSLSPTLSFRSWG